LKPFLSIVVPFHNSVETSSALLATLSRLKPEDHVELILVDDGSTDGTLALLEAFAAESRVEVQVLTRENGGPGAARNTGMEKASGRYIWFVDSDDDIDLSAIAFAREADWPEADVIGWDWEHPWIRRNLRPGLHEIGQMPAPLDAFYPVVVHWFSNAFLRRTSLRFPEHTFFEATPIEGFVLPLVVESYRDVDRVAYRGNVATQSVTRTGRGFDPSYYDRLTTFSLGMAFADRARLDTQSRLAFETAFTQLYLWYTIRLSRLPGPSWIRGARVMRQYREEARRLGLTVDPFASFKGRLHTRAAFRLLWAISAALPPQDRYFARLRARVWRRPLEWSSPDLPARWR